MEGIDLKSMPLDELWALHETICSMLARKLEAEKRSYEQRLNELRRRVGKAANETSERRVRELLAAGKTIDDLRIRRSQLRDRSTADE